MNYIFDNLIVKSIVITVISGIVFELLKYFFIFIKNYFLEKTNDFSISGYWLAKIKSINKENILGYELVEIKQKGLSLRVRIYQLVVNNDTCVSNIYGYVGKGYIKSNKLTFVYTINSSSSHMGSFNLLVVKEDVHSNVLSGEYSEYYERKKKFIHENYLLKSIKISLFDRCMLKLLKDKYAKKYLSNLVNDNEK